MANPSFLDPVIFEPSRTPEREALARVQESLANARHDREKYDVSVETVKTLEEVVERFEALIARNASYST